MRQAAAQLSQQRTGFAKKTSSFFTIDLLAIGASVQL